MHSLRFRSKCNYSKLQKYTQFILEFPVFFTHIFLEKNIDYIWKKRLLPWFFLKKIRHVRTAPKCPYSEFFWYIFSRIRTEYRDILHISPYSVQTLKNTVQRTPNTGTFYAVLTTNDNDTNDLGTNYMAIFNPGWNFNSLSWVEISSRLNSKLLFKITLQLHVKISTRYTKLKFQLGLANPKGNFNLGWKFQIFHKIDIFSNPGWKFYAMHRRIPCLFLKK